MRQKQQIVYTLFFVGVDRPVGKAGRAGSRGNERRGGCILSGGHPPHQPKAAGGGAIGQKAPAFPQGRCFLFISVRPARPVRGAGR